MISRNVLLLGGLLSALSVVLGAFGAHGLKDKVGVDQLQVFETGVRYQFYHAIALMLSALIMDKYSLTLRWPISLFIAGILLFSGSLYLLSTRELLGIDHWKRVLGPITPLGGTCLIAGWLSLCYSVWRNTAS
jgi:uncharacterized membrane protein YgdD (TMEM256/DUF423 family)